ncbi:hypothetical protein HK405_014888, partial [Cladochytrium tenue]
MWYAEMKQRPFFPIQLDNAYTPSWSGMILSGLPKADLAAASAAAAAADELASDPWLDALAEVAARVSRLRSPTTAGRDSNPGFAAARLRRLSTRLGAFSITMAIASAAASSPGGSRSSVLFGSPPSTSSSPPERRAKRQSVIIDPVADASPRWSTEIRGRPSSFQNHVAAGSALSHRHNSDSDSLALLQAWLRPVLPPERQPSASSASSITSAAAAAAADPELAKLASRLHPGTRNWLVEAVRDWALDAESPGVLWLRGGAGSGKSVAFAHLLETFRGNAVGDVDMPVTPFAHVCLRSDRGGAPASASAAAALNTLAFRLAALSRPLRAALLAARAVALAPAAAAADDEDDAPVALRFRRLIADPLAAVLCNDDERDFDGRPLPQSLASESDTLPPLILAIDGVDALPPDALRDLCLAIAGEAARPPFSAAHARSSPSKRPRRRVKFLFAGCHVTAFGRDLDSEIRQVLGAGEFAPAVRQRTTPPPTPLLRSVELAGVNQRRDLTQLAMSMVRSVLDDPDASDADDLEEAARALTEKSHGCFLWMALAFEPLLHPGIGGDVIVVGDPAGGAT